VVSVDESFSSLEQLRKMKKKNIKSSFLILFVFKTKDKKKDTLCCIYAVFLKIKPI
tara:strand:- start:130 stop:297 length:168 start_codon:yes stop_codon:yes gene_type:complete